MPRVGTRRRRVRRTPGRDTVAPLPIPPPENVCLQPTIRFPYAAPFEFCFSLYSIHHTQYSHFWPTGQLINRSTNVPLSCPRASGFYRCIPCQRVNLPACPLAQARVPVSPCPRAPSRMRLRRAHLCTGAALRFAPLHCLYLVHRASEPPGLSGVPLVNVSPCPRVPSWRTRLRQVTPPSRSLTYTAPCSIHRRSGRNPCGPG